MAFISKQLEQTQAECAISLEKHNYSNLAKLQQSQWEMSYLCNNIDDEYDTKTQ